MEDKFLTYKFEVIPEETAKKLDMAYWSLDPLYCIALEDGTKYYQGDFIEFMIKEKDGWQYRRGTIRAIINQLSLILKDDGHTCTIDPSNSFIK